MCEWKDFIFDWSISIWKFTYCFFFILKLHKILPTHIHMFPQFIFSEHNVIMRCFCLMPYSILFLPQPIVCWAYWWRCPGAHHGAREEWWDKQKHGPLTINTEWTRCKSSACMALSHCHLTFMKCWLISNMLLFTITREHLRPHELHFVGRLPDHKIVCRTNLSENKKMYFGDHKTV